MPETKLLHYVCVDRGIMAQYLFSGNYTSAIGIVQVNLLLINWRDKEVDFIYSPHLDITGYGKNFAEAEESFKIVLADFFDYTIKKKTLNKVLIKLGWQVKGKARVSSKVIAPSISNVIANNKHVSDIFDKYNTNTFHRKVGVPAMV